MKPITVIGPLILVMSIAACGTTTPTEPVTDGAADRTATEPTDKLTASGTSAKSRLCADVAGDDAAVESAVRSLLVDAGDPDRVAEIAHYTGNVCTWEEMADQPVAEAMVATNLVTEADLLIAVEGPTDSEEPSANEKDGGQTGRVCTEYFEALATDPTVVRYQELDPANMTAPLGIPVPVADCAAELEQGGGHVTYNLGWEETGFMVVHDALLAGGLVVSQPWEDDTSRKYKMSNADGAGLYWLDSGEGIMPGIATDDVLFVWVE